MLFPWRITGMWTKTLYIVVGYAAIALLFLALRTWVFSTTSWPYALIGFVVNLAYIVIGVRSFRGYLEPIAPPRSWWRWTGRPKAGFWLGALHAVTLFSLVQELWPRDGVSPSELAASLNILGAAVAAFGYLNSSFRLRRHPELWSQRRPTRKETVASDR